MNKPFSFRYITHTPKRTAGFFLLFVVFIMIFQSCVKKEDFEFNDETLSGWSPNIVAPLVHSKLTLSNILTGKNSIDQLIQVDSITHLLTLIYRDTVFSQTAEELIHIPDQTYHTDTTLNVSFPGGIPVDSIVTQPCIFYFSTSNGERFDSVYIKTAILNIAINSNANHNARIYITVPNLLKNGVPYQKTITYTYNGSVPVIVNDTCLLNGYLLKLDSGKTMTLKYILAFYRDANPDMSPYYVNLDESITGITFSKLFGYLGQTPISFKQDSVELNIFKNNTSGSFRLKEPKLYIYANNAIGMPISLNFDLLEAVKLPNNIVNISGTGFPNPWLIASPTYNQLGESIESSFMLDNTNSNVDDAINILPTLFNCQASGITNPNGNPDVDKNFIFDTSRIGLDVKVELPLFGRAWDFILQDTIDFPLDADVMDKVETMLFKFNITNGFPMEANMQIYFADSILNPDSTYIILDSMFVPAEEVICSGKIGSPPDYKVISPTYKYSQATIDKNKVARLVNTKKLILRSRLATTNNGTTDVKIFSYYDIDVKIGLQVKTKSIIKK